MINGIVFHCATITEPTVSGSVTVSSSSTTAATDTVAVTNPASTTSQGKLFHNQDNRHMYMYSRISISRTRTCPILQKSKRLYELKCILIAFSKHNLTFETFLHVQITRICTSGNLNLLKKIVPSTSRYRDLTVLYFPFFII